MIDYNKLRSLVDEGSFNAVLHDESGIVSVTFSIGDTRWSCQYDAENTGIYSLRLDGSEQIENVVRALRASADAVDAATGEA